MKAEMEKLIRNSFIAFAFKCYATINTGRRLKLAPYLKLLAKEFALVAERKTRKLAVAVPPRHGKTTMGSIALPAWIVGHDPAARVMIITYGAELAEDIVPQIRTVMQSDWYKQAFQTRLTKKKVDDLVTTDGGRIRAVSIEGATTGKGGDYLILDDVVQIKDHDNIKVLERANQLFDSAIRTRLDNPREGCIVILMHRLHENDLIGHVSQQSGWKQIALPLIAPRSRKYDLGNGKTWHRKTGELLRPGAMTAGQIAELRASRQKPGFETLQQQNPGGADRLHLKPEHFPTFDPAQVPSSELPVVLSIDPGLKGAATNDYSVIQVYSPCEEGHLLRNQWRERARFDDVRSATLKLMAVYRPSVILIEDTGMGPTLLDKIKPQRGMEVVKIKQPGEDKIERLRKHRALIRNRLVQLSAGAPWLDDFIAEVTVFPHAGFDDQVDAMTQYLDWITTNPKPQKRPAMGLIQGVDSQGRPMSPTANVQGTQAKGCVVLRRSQQTFNAPFRLPKVTVKY
jgi:predicted phage terminase large subunit-like protein